MNKQAIIDLSESGYAIEEIADELGITEEEVSEVLEDSGIL